MKAPHELLKDAAQADPRKFRQIAATARGLAANPDFLRLKSFLDGLVDRHGLSFAPTYGATAIDPLLAALREGAKLYPTLIELLAQAGELEDPADGSNGVEQTAEPYRTDNE